MSSLILPLSSLFINPLAFWIPPLRFPSGFSNPVCPKFILFSSTPSQCVLPLVFLMPVKDTNYSVARVRNLEVILDSPLARTLMSPPQSPTDSTFYYVPFPLSPLFSSCLDYHNNFLFSLTPIMVSLNPSHRWLPTWIKFKLLISHAFNDLATAFSGFIFYFSYAPPTPLQACCPRVDLSMPCSQVSVLAPL